MASYRGLAGAGWAELGFEHSYMWHQLPHHLHEAGLGDELADLLASPDYIVKKAAHFGHESLAIDRVALGRHDRPDTMPGARPGFLPAADASSTASPQSATSRPPCLLPPSAAARIPAVAAGSVTWSVPRDSTSSGRPAKERSDRGHTGAVAAVAAHGDALVSGGEDGTVRIWDLAEARPVRQRRGHTGWVYAVAISPDGRTIASAGDDATIRLWRLDTGESTGVLSGHLRRIRSLVIHCGRPARYPVPRTARSACGIPGAPA